MLGSSDWPTALHVVVPKQSTPDRLSASVGDSLGLGTSVHVVPFHVSASVRPGFTPSLNVPTAWQNELPTQETPERVLLAPLASDPSGLETIDHAVPFHCSTSVEVELAPSLSPTATQSAGSLQETPRSSLSVDAAGAGVSTIVHDEPFHCSTRGTVVDPLCADPTAMQSVLLGQDTAKNWDAVAEGGSGALTVSHAAPFHCSIRIESSTAPTAAQND